jgi:hypothetical protein
MQSLVLGSPHLLKHRTHDRSANFSYTVLDKELEIAALSYLKSFYRLHERVLGSMFTMALSTPIHPNSTARLLVLESKDWNTSDTRIRKSYLHS